MRPLICLLFSLAFADAELKTTTTEWRPACDGADIETVSDDGKIQSVRATAFHSQVIIEWSIHYVDGTPVSAQFREIERGRITEGDTAGEYSGNNRIKRILTFKPQDGRFVIADPVLEKELAEILPKIRD